MVIRVVLIGFFLIGSYRNNIDCIIEVDGTDSFSVRISRQMVRSFLRVARAGENNVAVFSISCVVEIVPVLSGTSILVLNGVV